MQAENPTLASDSKNTPDHLLPSELRRIDAHYIASEIGQLFNFDRGIFYSVKELFTRPGQSIRIYLSENRNKLVKPIFYIIVTSLFYTLCNHYFHFEDGYVAYLDSKKSATTEIFKWIQGNYGYANIIMSIFIALCIKLFFRKFPYNFFEIMVLLCYVMGTGMLIYSLFGIIQGLTKSNLMQIAGIVGFIYTTWSIGQFYGKDKIGSYVKAFFAYLAGMLLFTILAILAGTIIDQIIAT